jgi:hypothetical protein
VTAGLAEEIGVPNHLRDTTGNDLASVLEQVDAVITTPSTSMLESMLQGLPVAMLDYHNCPHYVPAAWSITSCCHIDQILPDLISPPPAKMLHQQTILHDALECHSPATPRLVELVTQMLRQTQQCLENGIPVKFSDRILADPQGGHHMPESSFDMRELYPHHPVFSNLDRIALQTEVGDGLLELHKLQKEYEELQLSKDVLHRSLQSQLQQCEASLSFRLGRAITWPLRALAELAR